MQEKDKHKLIQKYLDGTITSGEQKVLLEWYRAVSNEEAVWLSEDCNEEGQIKARIFKNLNSYINSQPQKAGSRTLWYRLAAAILIVMGLGFYFLMPAQKQPPIAAERFKNDIAPGGNKAILTLADGSKVSLTDAGDGELIKQAGIRIVKTADNQLIYTIVSSKPVPSNSRPAYNTIETPRGGQYQVNLPDGTRVWLNAASSLKYPIAFTGNERKVEMTGEGYFEVAKVKSGTGKKHIPFIVKTRGQEILVLGTHFNINAYTDEEAVRTTLLEGSVRIVPVDGPGAEPLKAAAGRMLKPGEQAVLKAGSIRINKADTHTIMAWKNNNFIFDDEGLESIMRKVSRWYDVDVRYESKPAGISFTGIVSRSKNISAVLHALESTGKVHFRIEGKEITIF